MTRLNFYSVKLVKEDAGNYNCVRCIKSNMEVAKIAFDVLKLHESAEERFIMLALDTKNNIRGIHTISVGSLNSSIVHPREVFKAAILNNANSVIFIHNHPSGDPTPSNEDIQTTQRLKSGGDILGINILDHIVVGDLNTYVSLREKDLM